MTCVKKRWLGAAVLFAAAVLIGAGCSKPAATPSQGGEKPKGSASGDEHAEKGPHGGVLAEWGEEQYHAELTVDHDKKQVVVYILDGKAKNAAPIKAKTITVSITNVQPPLQLTLNGESQKGDPEGSYSRFAATHDKLGTVMDFKGEISGEVDNKPYAGKFDEKGHDHKK